MSIFSNPKVHAGDTKGGPGTPRNGWLWGHAKWIYGEVTMKQMSKEKILPSSCNLGAEANG